MTEARTYECMVLLDNREVKSNWESLHGSLQSIFTKHGAKILSSKPWGERRLAFPIKRQTRATYLLNYLEAEPGQVAGIRRDLHFNESVLRNLILVCEEVPEDVFGDTEFDPSSVHTEDLPLMPPTEPEPGEEKEGGTAEGEESTEQAKETEVVAESEATPDAGAADSTEAEDKQEEKP